ncbi:hypothetical protein AAVH_22289 [Aphelenchoides avenae]|nr:hypothetical protein AAVH_22289 [Aphelenchus avenae]
MASPRGNGFSDSVQVTVENVGNGKVALKSCGKYLCITEDGSTVNCHMQSRAGNKWSNFDWIEHDSREVSLRGANGKYVPSADGHSFVTCDPDEAGPQERFTISACFKGTHP